MLTAAWITAAATAVLGIGAIFTALYAAAAFRKQSAELTTLQAQAADQQRTNEKLSAAAELQAEELGHQSRSENAKPPNGAGRKPVRSTPGSAPA